MRAVPLGVCEAGVKEEIVAVLRGAAANKEGELCVQAIFLLLDVLKKWAEDAKGTAAFSASGTKPWYLPQRHSTSNHDGSHSC